MTAIKVLTLAEEYLADHFPRFPVMPGVMMLESMHPGLCVAGAKVRRFRPRDCGAPRGPQREVFEFCRARAGTRGEGHDREAGRRRRPLSRPKPPSTEQQLSAPRLVLERYNLADRYPTRAATDAFATRRMREQFDRCSTGRRLSGVSAGLTDHQSHGAEWSRVCARPWPLRTKDGPTRRFPDGTQPCQRKRLTKKSIGDDAHGTHERRSV